MLLKNLFKSKTGFKNCILWDRKGVLIDAFSLEGEYPSVWTVSTVPVLYFNTYRFTLKVIIDLDVTQLSNFAKYLFSEIEGAKRSVNSCQLF